MADIIERMGVIQTKDDDGTQYALYPVTKAELVGGLDAELDKLSTSTYNAIENRLNGLTFAVPCTEAEYEAMESHDPGTLYILLEELEE